VNDKNFIDKFTVREDIATRVANNKVKDGWLKEDDVR
jgi:hypothetical protein